MNSRAHELYRLPPSRLPTFSASVFSPFRIPTSALFFLPSFPLPQNEPDWRFVQVGGFPQLIDQIPFV